MVRYHSQETTIHKGAYVGATDPGTVGPDKLWVQRVGSAPYAIHVRNAGNTAWENVGANNAVLFDPTTKFVGIVVPFDSHTMLRGQASFNGTSDAFGFWAEIDITGPTSAANWAVMGLAAAHNTTGTIDQLTGVFGRVQSTAGSNSNEGAGVRAQYTGDAGALVSFFGMRVHSPDMTSATLTNSFGVYVEPQGGTGVTNAWEIFADGRINVTTGYFVGGTKVVGARQANVANAVSANAPAQTASYVQADVQAIATLCNELKTQLNAALAVLHAHGLMA